MKRPLEKPQPNTSRVSSPKVSIEWQEQDLLNHHVQPASHHILYWNNQLAKGEDRSPWHQDKKALYHVWRVSPHVLHPDILCEAKGRRIRISDCQKHHPEWNNKNGYIRKLATMNLCLANTSGIRNLRKKDEQEHHGRTVCTTGR